MTQTHFSDFVENKSYTLDEYLAIEELAEQKHAFYNGQVVNVSNGIDHAHCIIAVNVMCQLAYPFDDKKRSDLCVLDSQMRYFIAEKQTVVYPDISIIKDKPQFFNNRDDVVQNPALVIEITSESTELFDRTDKFELYATLPSFKEYVLVSQKQKHVEVRTYKDENVWEMRRYRNPTDRISLKTIDCEVVLDELYTGVNF